MFQLAVGIIAFLAAVHAAPSTRSPTATIRNGTYSGVHSSTYDQDFFFGVPYAQPPVGELRFRNPQSLNTTFGSTLQATEYAPECVGYGVCIMRWTVEHPTDIWNRRETKSDIQSPRTAYI